jgi:hypothetical protein
MGVYLRLFNEASSLITDFLWWYRFLSMENCAPSIFLRSWVLMASYLCFRFYIFNRPILEKYVFHVEGGPCLVQSCLGVVWNNLNPHITKEMHPFLRVWHLLTPQVFKHFLWTFIMTHLLSLFWKMTSFFWDLKPAFILVWARGRGYGWLLGHLFVHLTSHILVSLRHCISIFVWFNLQHLVFSRVNVDMG